MLSSDIVVFGQSSSSDLLLIDEISFIHQIPNKFIAGYMVLCRNMACPVKENRVTFALQAQKSVTAFV
jgi:hypothetical protein